MSIIFTLFNAIFRSIRKTKCECEAADFISRNGRTLYDMKLMYIDGELYWGYYLTTINRLVDKMHVDSEDEIMVVANKFQKRHEELKKEYPGLYW